MHSPSTSRTRKAYYKKHRKEIRLQQKKYHAQWYRKNRKSKLRKNRHYLKTHPESNRRAALRWRNNNLERARQSARNWYAKPENIKSAHRARRRRLKEALGSNSVGDRRVILKRQNYRCIYCDADLKKVQKFLDHIVAVTRGGSNDRKNLQYLCVFCSGRKGIKDPVLFGHEMGLKNPPRGQTNEQYLRTQKG